MKKYFLDCGSNIGQGYEYFRQKYGPSYEYILFEPNPNCYNVLVDKYINDKNVTVYNKAVYVKDCIMPFKFVTDFCVGGSIIEGHNSAYFDKKQETQVDCFDLINKIDYLAKDNSEIIIKLDIESSEYDVLEKMIETKTIFKVKKIYCEFHTQYMNAADRVIYVPRETKIMEFIQANNIAFEIWH